MRATVNYTIISLYVYDQTFFILLLFLIKPNAMMPSTASVIPLLCNSDKKQGSATGTGIVYLLMSVEVAHSNEVVILCSLGT